MRPEASVISRRLLVSAALALWIGGLVLYAAAVVPAGHAVFASATVFGFVTQRVTRAINVAATVACVALGWELTRLPGLGRRRMVVALALLAVDQVGLFALHPVLSGHLDAVTRSVRDPDGFYRLHRVYLLASTLQIGVAVALAWWLLSAWRAQDRALPADDPT